MKLYHGTSERAARLALQHGLLPRDESGVESNWEDNPSGEGYVYLTAAYASYFALSACEEGERCAIIEIDTDLLPCEDDYLVPDEDFLEQATRGQELPEEWGVNGASMEARTKWFRENLYRFGHVWKQSVEGLGNCAHEGAIPPEAITRVVYFDFAKNGLALMAVDPCITLLNYRLCGNKYRALTKWFFGDEVSAADFSMHGAMSNMSPENAPPEMESFIRQQAEQNAAMEKALADRTGLEVCNV
jgi:hypothetical protein